MPEVRKKHSETISSTEFDFERDFSVRLKRSKEQLAVLREQQEQIEREKRELEGLKMETEELEAEKRETMENLNGTIALLEDEEQALKKKQQEVTSTKKEFETLIKEIRIAEKRSQKAEDVRQQILIEKAIVAKAKECLERGSKKLEFLEDEIEEVMDDEDGTYPIMGPADGFKVGLGLFAAGGLISIILYILFMIVKR
jgi:chromosome segregation ATPase